MVMDEQRAILLFAIAQNKRKIERALGIVVNPKSAEASEDARKKGNALFLQSYKHDAGTHEKIFNCYCESIALAPNESHELALAYGNKSYFLLHIHKYEDCIKDIDRALEITDSDLLKAKLLCRKAECLKKLGYSNFSIVLEMAQKFISKIDGQDKIKLLEMADAVKTLIVNFEVSNDQKEKSNALPITDDYFSRISIQYNEKYGRHLVAAKDYKPGDIIINEKIFASFIPDRLYTYCHSCSKAVWSSVPCQYCDWTMFCSHSCREKAWNDFHDIECFLVSHLKATEPGYWKYFMLPIRVLITGIKETGNIANLREKIEFVDNCTDVTSKGFFINGEFLLNSIQNIYSLTYDERNDSIAVVSFIIPLILIGLTNYSKLKDSFDVKQVEDLVANEDIIFLGSLLIKIIAVVSTNGYAFTHEIVNTSNSDSSLLGRHFMTTLCSLFNHSCFPTAEWRYTEQNTLAIIALQPIKRNSQIFVNYAQPFYGEQKSIRHEFLSKYNFICNCQACEEAWPPIISLLNQSQLTETHDLTAKNNDILIEFYKQFEKGKINAKFIRKLCTLITQASNYKQPSLSYCLLTDLFRAVLTKIYSPKPPSFDLCN